MNEKRYKVTLNWYGEIRVFWTHADSNTQAKSFVLQKFAKEIGRIYTIVLQHFNGTKDNILIEEV